MKKAIRNILAIALATCVTMPMAACKKDSKRTSRKADTENSDRSDEESDDRADDQSGDTSTGSNSDANTLKTLKANASRTIKEDDPFYTTELSELKVTPPEGVEFATKEFTTASIVGDRILANVRVTLKQESMGESLLQNDFEKYDEELYCVLQLFDLDGQYIATIPLGEDCDFLRAFPMANDEILVTAARYNRDDCKAKPCFFVISSSGEKIRDLQFDVPESLYSLQAYPMENGNIFIAADGNLFLFDSEGKQIKRIKDQSLGCYMNYSDGKWYVARTMPPSNTIGAYQEVDINTGELKTIYKVDEILAEALTKNTDCLLFKETGVEQYSIESGKTKQILSHTSTNVNCAHLTNGRISTDGQMLLLDVEPDKDNTQFGTACYLYQANTMSVVKLTRAEKNPNAGKELLKLGIFLNEDPFFLDKVLEYNSDPSNHAYIEMYTISSFNLTEYDPDDAVIRFLGEYANKVKEEMYQGTGPDLLVGFSDLAELNTDAYLFDLKQYLESDASIKKDDYFLNILDAFATDGKIYSMPLTYTLHGMAVNSTATGVKEKWTVDGLDKIKASLPADMELFPNYEGVDLLLSIMSACTSDFVDYEKGEADFNNDPFKSLLKVLKDYTVPDAKYGSGVINRDGKFLTPDLQYSSDIASAYTLDLNNLEDFCILKSENASRETVFTGYPSAKGKNMTAQADLSMSITKCASNPDLAWEVIRYFLGAETQQNLSSGMNTLPVSRVAFNSNSQAKIDLNAELLKEYEKDPENFGSKPVQISEERKDAFAGLISSVDNAYRLDSEITKIVLDEANRYFHGYQGLDFICQTIQQRVTEVLKARKAGG